MNNINLEINTNIYLHIYIQSVRWRFFFVPTRIHNVCFLHSIFRHEWFCLVLNKLRHSCNGSRWWKDCLSLQQIPFFTTHINRQTTRLAIGNRQMDNINWRLDIIKSIRCYDIVMEVTAWHHAMLSTRNGQMHLFIDCRIWWTHFYRFFCCWFNIFQLHHIWTFSDSFRMKHWFWRTRELQFHVIKKIISI